MSPDVRAEMWEHNPDALLVTDTQGSIMQWNPAAESIFGYGAAEARGHTIGSLIVPQNRLAEEQQAYASARRDGLVVLESVRRRKDGTLVQVNISIRAMRDAAGAVTHFLHSNKDVTDLKVMRDAKLVKARFQDFLESTPDAIVMVNVTGRIVMVNTQAETLFGYSRGQLRGQSVEFLLPPRFRQTHIGHRAAFFDAPRTRTMGAGLELYGLRSSGEEFPVEISLSPLQTEEGTMVMSAIRDITDRRKADKKFRDLLESAPDAMVIVDQEGRMVQVNHQSEQLFGWSRDDMLGQSIDMLVPARLRERHPAHRSGFFAKPRARAMGAGLELYGLRKDGSEVPVEISLSPLETEDGVFVCSAIRDVTERRRNEQALRDKNLELEATAKARDEFFASMSHELRTPLNAVIGFTGTLRMELPGPLNREQQRQLELVQSSANHLLSLINDLLDLARIERNPQAARQETVDVQQLLQEIAATFGPQAERKGLVLGLELPQSPFQLQTDRRALRQILFNLTDNAIKYAPQGEIRLGARAQRQGQTTLHEFWVQDMGPGIAVADQARIFEPFARFDSGTQPAPTGAGLGLHVSRKLALALGGELIVHSAPQGGCRFTLTL